jgi:hypothetical protein
VRTTVAPAGGIYALRKSLFRPLPADRVVMDDFLIAMGVLREGFNVKYEPSARAVEQSAGSIEGEFRRKIRIGAANFSGISEFADLLRPGAGIVAFMLWSHKILRWCVPFLLIAASAAAMALATGSEFFGIVRLVIAGCLLLGAAGFIADRAGIRIGIFGYPYYFLVVNAALLAGFFRFLGGTQKSTWEVVR